jgi:hypothetical protein
MTNVQQTIKFDQITEESGICHLEEAATLFAEILVSLIDETEQQKTDVSKPKKCLENNTFIPTPFKDCTRHNY